jgi:hypothetical protein
MNIGILYSVLYSCWGKGVRVDGWLDGFFSLFVGLAYQGKDIVFRFIIEYSSFRDFGP